MKLLGKFTRHWVLAGMLVGAVIFALLGPDVSARVRRVANSVLTPFGDVGMYMTTAFKTHSGLGREVMSPAEIRRLKEVNKELQGRLRAVEGELERLIRRQSALRDLYARIPYAQWELIPARVVAADSLPYGQMRVLNVGKYRGAVTGVLVTTRRALTDRSKALPRGLAVMSTAALVGEVVDAGRFTAQLRLITDQGFRISARIRRDLGIARKITVTDGPAEAQPLTRANNRLIDVQAVGSGAGGLIVKDVNAYHNIVRGDWLETSGEDASLPVRIPIGRVVEVIDDPQRTGLFVSLRIEPFVDLPALREVYIVVPAGAAGKGIG